MQLEAVKLYQNLLVSFKRNFSDFGAFTPSPIVSNVSEGATFS